MVVGINESSRYHFSRHHTCQLNAINIRRQMTRGTFTIIFILFINYRIEFHLWPHHHQHHNEMEKKWAADEELLLLTHTRFTCCAAFFARAIAAKSERSNNNSNFIKFTFLRFMHRAWFGVMLIFESFEIKKHYSDISNMQFVIQNKFEETIAKYNLI